MFDELKRTRRGFCGHRHSEETGMTCSLPLGHAGKHSCDDEGKRWTWDGRMPFLYDNPIPKWYDNKPLKVVTFVTCALTTFSLMMYSAYNYQHKRVQPCSMNSDDAGTGSVPTSTAGSDTTAPSPEGTPGTTSASRED